MDGRELFVGRAQQKSESQEELRISYAKRRSWGANLYVRHFDRDMDDERLRKVFEVFGTITSSKIMTDSDGRSRGFAFVCYSSPCEAEHAQRSMNGRVVGKKALVVVMSKSKEQREEELRNQAAPPQLPVSPPA